MNLISSIFALFSATPYPHPSSIHSFITLPQKEIAARGWRSVRYDRWDMHTDMVWLWRAGWPSPSLYETNSIPPQMNVYDLWWKPWRPSDDEVPK